jgi:hypothetical protein
MKILFPKLPLCVLMALAYVGGSAVAADEAPTSRTDSVAVAGWNELLDSLRDLPAQLLAKLPQSMRDDPQIRQEVGRLMLEALTSSALDVIGGDGDHPSFLPQIGQVLDVGQPNADTIYRVARVTPGGTYRLRGMRGSLRLANIGQVGARPGPTRVYHDLNALQVDSLGRFDVLLSPVRPAGYDGDWWQLEPSTTKLLLRLVSDDWSRERDPTITIERIDQPVGRPRRSAADLEQRLRSLPGATAFIAQLFIDHVEQLRSQGYVNKLRVFDTAQLGGLTGQFYYEGAYDLRDDEALIVEAKVPAHCVYRSIILTNEIYETTDWYDNQSSLNDSQAQPDSDGVLRIVVSERDPGVANWLDTAGYSRGVIQGRWTSCSEQPVPNVRKVALTDLRSSLPALTHLVTPDERTRQIRERRFLLQQRPLW